MICSLILCTLFTKGSSHYGCNPQKLPFQCSRGCCFAGRASSEEVSILHHLSVRERLNLDGVVAGLDVQQTRETFHVAHWKISQEHFVNPEKSEASSGIRRQQYFGSRSNIHYRPLLQDLKNALLWRSICRKRNLITLKAVQHASQQFDTTKSLKIVQAYSNASAWQQLL